VANTVVTTTILIGIIPLPIISDLLGPLLNPAPPQFNVLVLLLHLFFLPIGLAETLKISNKVHKYIKIVFMIIIFKVSNKLRLSYIINMLG